MKLTEVISASPASMPQSVRRNDWRCLTSADPGKIIPLAYAPLLREDRVSRGAARIRVEMAETVLPLLNAVGVTAYAHFVPFLAFDRFNGLDQLNRSYMGQPETDGGAVVPFFETITYDPEEAIFKTMGIHAPDESEINSAVVEAYNVLVNFRRKARSTKLPLRLKDETTLATGFWRNSTMSHIVPDYDAAMLDGEVELALDGEVTFPYTIGGNVAFRNAQGIAPSGNSAPAFSSGTETALFGSWYRHEDLRLLMDNIKGELAQESVTLSLNNIEQAKRTVAWARVREQYSGLDDDHIIDMLMSGIRVPDAQMAQPILLDRQTTIVGMNQRFATDSGNLDKSVTRGEAFLSLNMRTPPMNTGGIILITLEAVPDQLFERQQDHFLTTVDVDDLPEAVRDDLDMDKVAVVPNSHVDVLHSQPTATFGYAGLNYQWNRNIPNIGGKFMRQLNDPFVEDRQRIWSPETVDPELTEDFYLANGVHKKVFADTLAEPFEITTIGGLEIVGKTVFGRRLQEDVGAYEAVEEKQPVEESGE
ncbi:hypothetical protein [Roseovarius amoyensis]|uniref:hypothetical protein n=1 Tax=Roseovarius amoyensis TaxID=2211448 RepID=UPI0013A6F649|nr:hypothetical protein [Roseovarius amoyensis]